MLIEEQFQKQKEVERLFAATAFIDPEYVVDTCGWLNPDSIIDKRVRKFWTLILDGRSNVEASHDADLQIELLEWVNHTPSSLYAREYANILTKRSYMTGIGITLEKVAKAIQDNDIETVQRHVDEMALHKRYTKEVIPDAGMIGAEFMQAVVADNNDIPTGIPGLDNNVGGLERHTVSVLAGRTSMGKTALALQIARNVAGPKGLKIVFFSLEMKRKGLWARMACGNAGVSWLDVRSKKITPQQEQRLLQESDKLIQQLDKKFYVVDDISTTDRVWQIAAQEKPDLIIIDHLRLLKDVIKGESEVKRQGWIMERLHDLAKSQDCHVMALAQLNRGVENRADKRPMLADLRDSGEIEENADLVFMLYRDDVYNPKDTPGQTSDTELLIRKFRDGVRDARIWLRFDTKKQWFSPVAGGGD